MLHPAEVILTSNVYIPYFTSELNETGLDLIFTPIVIETNTIDILQYGTNLDGNTVICQPCGYDPVFEVLIQDGDVTKSVNDYFTNYYDNPDPAPIVPFTYPQSGE